MEDSGIPDCPVLHPTEKQFENFDNYVKHLSSRYGRFGIVRIVPPQGWKARESYECIENGQLDFDIGKPIEQHWVGQQGVYRQINIVRSKISFQKFRKLALAEEKDRTDRERRAKDKRFWASMGNEALRGPLYGADTCEASLFEDCAGAWDMRCLPNLLQRTVCQDIKGVTSSTVFVGMWRSAFAWHCEDMDLYSINYLHYGDPKQWWGIPASANQRFDTLCDGLFPGQRAKCGEFLRHKCFLVSPSVVKANGIPVARCIQRVGEFVITFPRSFHCGFNHGFNVAEACNFATTSWIPTGRAAKRCTCTPGAVEIDMRLFEPDGVSRADKLAASLVEGDLVWAKLPDYPVWPAQVCKPATAAQRRELQNHPGWVMVLFYGEIRNWAVVNPADIEIFAEDYPTAKNWKENPELSKAITEALDDSGGVSGDASKKRRRKDEHQGIIADMLPVIFYIIRESLGNQKQGKETYYVIKSAGSEPDTQDDACKEPKTSACKRAHTRSNYQDPDIEEIEQPSLASANGAEQNGSNSFQKMPRRKVSSFARSLRQASAAYGDDRMALSRAIRLSVMEGQK